ncbi:DUF1405 domain-containing protein [Bacillus sp. SM2101]|uniref:DUF1405 domain-containing protein n=1 Tax=Bacillus sp. SM2101 TaxID=2805366 RepID=UPI001BDF16DB|nr:DUF1405 domain-containing protein [Bacillus sp. SM2101]
MRWIVQALGQRWVLFSLLVINTLGTIYGYYWYRWQLYATPPKYLIFVPDSPTASLFFVFVLVAFLLKKNWGLIEALAIVTLFKYGIWAVVMNILVYFELGSLDFASLMLIFSHGAMAMQGLLFAPFYRIKWYHLAIASVWTLHNDVIDYVFGMLPWYHVLNEYVQQIGYFTFWLSIASIGITYVLCVKKDRFVLRIT